jgi:hypothetical protein
MVTSRIVDAGFLGVGHHFRKEFLPGHGFDTRCNGTGTDGLAGWAVDQQAAHLLHLSFLNCQFQKLNCGNIL